MIKKMTGELGIENGHIVCIFTKFPFFSLEKWAFPLNDRANADLISAVVMRNVPRLIPTLRENFQFVF